MQQLAANDLKDYIKYAIDLESSKVAQNLILNNFNQRFQSKKPQLVQKDTLSYPVAPSTGQQMAEGGVGVIVSAVFCLMGGVFELGWFFFIVMGIVPAVFFFALLLSAFKVKRTWEEKCDNIAKHNEAVRAENRKATQEYNESLTLWKSSFDETTDYLKKHLEKTQDVLETYYSLDIIYPKYRTLPALTSIYEYLETGRCSELTGPHGAYNLYEDELRKDTVISQLNTIIENLEQIKRNQYMLYQRVSGILENTNRIASELNAIKGYTVALTELTALNTYYNGINAVNTSAMSFFRGL